MLKAKNSGRMLESYAPMVAFLSPFGRKSSLVVSTNAPSATWYQDDPFEPIEVTLFWEGPMQTSTFPATTAWTLTSDIGSFPIDKQTWLDKKTLKVTTGSTTDGASTVNLTYAGNDSGLAIKSGSLVPAFDLVNIQQNLAMKEKIWIKSSESSSSR